MNVPARNLKPYIVAVSITVFLIFLAYLMFFVPKMNEVKVLGEQTLVAKSDNVTLERRVALVSDNAKHIGDLQAKVSAFNQSFPVGASQEDLLSRIVAAGDASGVSVTGVNPTAPEAVIGSAAGAQAAAPSTAAPATPAPTGETSGIGLSQAAPGKSSLQGQVIADFGVTINAIGKPDALQAFLANLESLKRPLTVKTFEMASGKDGPSSLTLTATSFLVAPLADPTKK